MANIIEAATWEPGIYQLETTDLVLGGADGIDNLQAKQLASRTQYLKVAIEGLGSGKQNADPTLAAIAALVGSADKMIYFTGGDVAALATITAYARTLIACADAAAVRASLSAVSQAELAAAVAALVNASPAQLDTLNELAAALGNDANFAATITAALALKAPLASPALTGNPTAPTAGQFDNDTSLATTAFVQRALGNFSGTIIIADTATLSGDQCGRLISLGGLSSYTITLPLLSECINGSTFYIKCDAGAPITIQRQGADQINVNAITVNALNLGNGDTLVIAKDGVQWRAIGGTGQLPYAAAFGANLASAGYQKLPSGLLIQWGTWTASATPGAAVAVTFPIAFPSAVYNVSLTGRSAGTGNAAAWHDTPTVNGFNGRAAIASIASNYLAIGK